jgi:hypothetical protein
MAVVVVAIAQIQFSISNEGHIHLQEMCLNHTMICELKIDLHLIQKRKLFVVVNCDELQFFLLFFLSYFAHLKLDAAAALTPT